MTERKQQTIAEATQVWELGLLRFLYDKGVITEDEFLNPQNCRRTVRNE